jgi:hypothetical protein
MKPGDKVFFVIAQDRFRNKEPMTGIGWLCERWQQPSRDGCYTIRDMEKWFKYERRTDSFYRDEGQPWVGRFMVDAVYPIEIIDTPLFKALEEE